MAPTIHLVRHAQGVHNLPGADGTIPDPDLTPLGEEQCARVRADFPSHDRITHLVASPMRRTLYTCIHSFGPDDADEERRRKLYPVTALDLLQEVSEARCDTGSAPEKLAAEFGDRVDVSGVDPKWTDKTNPESKFEPTMAKLVARAREARRALRDIAGKGDGHLVAVSHGGFLHFLTDDWHGIPSDSGKFLPPSPSFCRFLPSGIV